MCKMTKCGACDSLKDELSAHIAEKAKGKSSGLKNGFSAVGLEYYIAKGCEQGEIIQIADWVYEGYNSDSVLNMFKRMLKSGQVTKLRKGLYEVC